MHQSVRAEAVGTPARAARGVLKSKEPVPFLLRDSVSRADSESCSTAARLWEATLPTEMPMRAATLIPLLYGTQPAPHDLVPVEQLLAASSAANDEVAGADELRRITAALEGRLRELGVALAP